MDSTGLGFSSYGQQPQQGYGQQPQQAYQPATAAPPKRVGSWESMDIGPPEGGANPNGYSQPIQMMDPNQGFAPQQQPPQPNQGFQQQPPQPQQQQQYQQQQQQQQGGFPTDPSAFMQDAATSQMAQMGMRMGVDMFQTHREKGREAMERYGLGSDTLRQYFHVDGSYVLSRLKLLAFPFKKSKNWRRQYQDPSMQYGQDPQQQAAVAKALSPREDENAPDLYIPSMAFITYVLAAGFLSGMSAPSSFSPEMLGRTSSYGIVLWVLEVLCFKFGLYIMHDIALPIWDAAAYAGYKYVCVVVSLLTYILLGTLPYYVVVLYSGSCAGFMMYKLYAEILFPSGMNMEKDGDTKKLLLMIGSGLQVVVVWFLGFLQT